MSSLLIVLFAYFFVSTCSAFFWKENKMSPLCTFIGGSDSRSNIKNIRSELCSYSPLEFPSIFSSYLTSYSQYVHGVFHEIEHSVHEKKNKFKFSKRHAFIILLIRIILREIFSKKNPTHSTENTQTTRTKRRHRIVFGASGGLCVYQFGFWKAIIEHFGADIFLNQCEFEGISGGAAATVFAMGSMQGQGTMDYFYKSALALPSYTAGKKPFGMLWTTSDLLYDIMYKYIHIWINNNGGTIPDWLWSKSHMSAWVTCINGFSLKNVLFSVDTKKHLKAEDIDAIVRWYSTSAKTTCLVPGVLSPQMYECIDGKRYNDGGIALVCGDKRIWEMKNKYDEDCKVLYINVDFVSGMCGKRQWHRKRYENGNIVYDLDTWKWAGFSMLDYAVWANKEYTDGLYQKGYDLAMQNMTEIEGVLNEFLSYEELEDY